MKRLKYSKKIDKLIKSGSSLRSIRKKMRMSKKGQMLRVKNIILGVVGAFVSIVIFLFASPFIKEIVSSTTSSMSSPLAIFVITALPYMVLLLVFLLLVFALRGDSYA